ncbi:MAG: hypothetical protein RBR08_13140 [Desulforegulaceae bacterium]|nr:hypothetical protein [Desulforegulaceae bacterium]
MLKLRNLQDTLRNKGFRIQWIPWQEKGKPEYVYNSPLTHIFNIVGLALFFMGIVSAAGIFEIWQNEYLSGINPSLPGIFISVSGIFFLLSGRIVAAVQKQKGWVKIEAQCIDWEVAQYSHLSRNGRRVKNWTYRLLCTFYFNGRKYTVTPENSKIIAFNTKKQAENYLESRISTDNKCFLYIDPQNPLHAVFDRKQRI